MLGRLPDVLSGRTRSGPGQDLDPRSELLTDVARAWTDGRIVSRSGWKARAGRSHGLDRAMKRSKIMHRLYKIKVCKHA